MSESVFLCPLTSLLQKKLILIAENALFEEKSSRMAFAQEVQSQWPKAWKYFIDFYQHEFEGKLSEVAFETLAFELQLGVYVRFFDQINGDIQLYATNTDALKEAVKEAFATYEEYLFLDS